MNALMFYKTALVNECLITPITSIWAFTTVYASMYQQIILVTE